jgi:hypothetical protein
MASEYMVIEARDIIKKRATDIDKLFEELYTIRFFVYETKPEEYEISEKEWKDIVASNKGYLVEWFKGRRNPPHVMNTSAIRFIVADYVNVADVILEEKDKISSEEATKRMDDLIDLYKTTANGMGYYPNLRLARHKALYDMVNRFKGLLLKPIELR